MSEDIQIGKIYTTTVSLRKYYVVPLSFDLQLYSYVVWDMKQARNTLLSAHDLLTCWRLVE